ncbi:MAG: GIY-YIG nuclease family protein [Actinomycetia bacterium]|nr:GIY-YIG nuclease family protein [Actinomycetes bacterium]
MSAESVAAALRAVPTSAAELSDAIPPAAPGFYGWWIRPGALPCVPTTRFPEAAPWGLLYVGIARGKSGSGATIRSRVTGHHLGGNAGSSTFRKSMASLLFEHDGWRLERRTRKVVLKREDNAALSRWIREHLALTWTEQADPWREPLESEAISLLRPPINLRYNGTHPFYKTVRAARGRFEAAAV